MGWAYVVIAAGDALFACLLSFVDVPAPERSATDAPLSRRSPFLDVWDGLIYTLGNPIVRVALGVILISEVFGWSVEPMLPVIARETLGLGASGLGMLFASASGGAAVAAFAISSVGDIRNKGRLMAVGMIAFGAFLLAFSLSRNFPLSLTLFALTGAATALYETAADTIIQSGVDTRMRGRVLSFQAMMWGVSGASGFYTRRHGNRIRRAPSGRHRRGDRNAGGLVACRAKGGAAGWGGRRGWGRSISSPLMGEVPA